jgi:ferric-dicitrate binding protein FerR (iron transport regulator)
MSGHTDTEMNLSELEEADWVTALLLKQLRQEITDDELQALNNYMAAHPLLQQVHNQVNNDTQLQADLLKFNQVDKDASWQKISEQTNLVKPRPFLRKWRVYVLAALIVIIAAATWWYMATGKKQKRIHEKYIPVVVNVPPGGNRASLTLSNGTVISLDNAANGTLAEEGNAKVVKLQNGELKYEVENTTSEVRDQQFAPAYNTLSTPRGGQYHMELPDGSKVWLNAASSITYPTRFTGSERRVAITGEVYFEVNEVNREGRHKIPFIVSINSPSGSKVAEIEVLGTSFNINAYADEDAIKTTLLKGRVKIVNRQSASDSYENNNQQSAILQPGQQAQLSGASRYDSIKVVNADTDIAIAWKNGFHSFKNADVKTIMRMLSRWYNFRIGYEGNIPNYKFTGSIPRSENLSSVISMLEYAGIHFRLDNDKIIVVP